LARERDVDVVDIFPQAPINMILWTQTRAQTTHERIA
jgi:hypothetical protein